MKKWQVKSMMLQIIQKRALPALIEQIIEVDVRLESH